jgi:Holliday junction resolvasome RuvABC endonuclease subunit
MTIISIDFSILYPGICICKDFKEFQWISVINTKITKKDLKNFEDLQLKYPKLKILFTETKREKSEQYHVTERTKLTNYLELTDVLVQAIKSEVPTSDDLIVSIEGISFGSSGNSLVDISQATGILKNKLVTDLLDGKTDRFFVFSPSELKNAIGCKGNANKLDIYSKFKSDPIIESVKDSQLHKAINSEDWILNGEKIISPIIDMIDSYLGVVKIHQLLK